MRCLHILENSKQCVRKSEKGDVVLEEGIYSYASTKRRGSSNEDGEILIKLLKYLHSLYGKLPLYEFKYKRGKEKNTWTEVMDFLKKNPQMFSSK